MIKNKKGVTLIELIMVISILSIVISITASILFAGTKIFSAQTINTNNQSNIRYALNIISKDIRRSDNIIVSSNTILLDDTIEYMLIGNNLVKNEQSLVTDIEIFHITKVGNKIIIEIKSLPNLTGHSLSLSSTIYIRR